MSLTNDADIFRISLTARKVNSLLAGENQLKPADRMVEKWWYIGRRGEEFVAFENRHHHFNAERIRVMGNLDAIYNCDSIDRNLPLHGA